MVDRIDEIDDLFSMFHDFDVIGLSFNDEVLTMIIILPWSEMWDIKSYKMTFQFFGVENLKCFYFKRTGTELIKWEKGLCYPTDEHVTVETNEIVDLELSIQSYEFHEPNRFILHCHSASSFGNRIGQIDFARIELNVKDYKIFDNEINEISLNEMKEWGKDWWNRVQKIWDEENGDI
jgi:hypothetical protein